MGAVFKGEIPSLPTPPTLDGLPNQVFLSLLLGRFQVRAWVGDGGGDMTEGELLRGAEIKDQVVFVQRKVEHVLRRR